MIFPTKPYNPSLILSKTYYKTQMIGILHDTWPVIFKTIKVIRNKESLGNSHSQDEPKETLELNVTWLNVMWYSK